MNNHSSTEMLEKIAKELLTKVKADYNEISVSFSETRRSEWREFESIGNFLKKNLDGNLGKVLDLGCGNGRLYAFLEKNFRNFQYVGVDISSALIDEAKRAHGKTTFIEGDMMSLPFPDKSFDTVFSIASLHHIPSQNFREKAMKEIHRVLKPNGLLILLVWNLWQKRYAKYLIKSAVNAIFGKYDLFDTFIPWQHTIDRYYHAFTHNKLRSLLIKTGLNIQNTEKGRNFVFFGQKSKKDPRNILGITFDTQNIEEILQEAPRWLSSDKQHFIVTPNPEILLHAQKNLKFRRILKKADLRIPDGTGILWAITVKNRLASFENFRFKHVFRLFFRVFLIMYAIFSLLTLIFWPKFCRKIIRNTVTGTDLLQKICQLKAPLKIFLLGAAPGIAEKTAKILQEKNQNLVIAGTDAGKSLQNDDERITNLIRRSEANALFVAFGAPEQEFWLSRNLSEMPNIRLAMGVGGAFDYIVGKRKRAPFFIRKMGLEWLYRLIQEPSRMKRIYHAVCRFPITIIRELW